MRSACCFQEAFSLRFDDMDRKAILQELLDTRFDGSQVDFARAIMRSPAQVNHWLSGYRRLGDGSARYIERVLGLPIGWMDGNILARASAEFPVHNSRTKVTANRRARLREWFATRTLPSREKSYLSRLMGGHASFGEKAARRLERDYGMGDGYLDVEPSANGLSGPPSSKRDRH
jgi:transcriptional regulator with XRE-family HTH domain